MQDVVQWRVEAGAAQGNAACTTLRREWAFAEHSVSALQGWLQTPPIGVVKTIYAYVNGLVFQYACVADNQRSM